MSDLAGELLKLVLEIAGEQRQTCAEINGFRDIAIFKDGVTL
jgi:altronate dehydratase